MINRIFRLMDAKRIEMVQREVRFSKGDILLRPQYLSICAADQRYYLGRRDRKAMEQKLPMALIHEAVGTVLHDFGGRLEAGAPAVMIPLEVPDAQGPAKENYRPSSRFMSSGCDGFMQDYIVTRADRIIPVPEADYKLYVFAELLSVVFNALDAFEKVCLIPKTRIGVWGDGSMGFVAALVLKCVYPAAKIVVFGKNRRKLERFSFVDQTYHIDAVPEGVVIDHGFECVGSTGSELAIEQAIGLIAPQGCMALMGVSETPVAVNTRKVLEKGLILLGNSRSNRQDFEQAVRLIHTNRTCKRHLAALVSETIDIKNENDIFFAFEQDFMNDFKTILRWGI